MPNSLQQTEIRKEIANVLTHGFGLLFSVVTVPVLISFAVSTGNSKAIIGAGIYGFSFIMVFASSTIYHSVKEPIAKRVMQIVDHISIYFLIAGSYTPFLLIYLDNSLGKTMLCVLWGITFLGIFYKSFLLGKYQYLSIAIYLIMGWMVIVFVKPFIAVIPTSILSLMLAGGLLYTIGVIFFVWKKYTYHHAFWHLFVLSGAIAHFVAVFRAIKG